jgi:hypothetical protein
MEEYRDVGDLIGLEGNLNLMVLLRIDSTLVMKGIMKCRPGSVQELSMAPPLL